MWVTILGNVIGKQMGSLPPTVQAQLGAYIGLSGGTLEATSMGDYSNSTPGQQAGLAIGIGVGALIGLAAPLMGLGF